MVYKCYLSQATYTPKLNWNGNHVDEKTNGRKRTRRLELQNREDPLLMPLVLLED